MKKIIIGAILVAAFIWYAIWPAMTLDKNLNSVATSFVSSALMVLFTGDFMRNLRSARFGKFLWYIWWIVLAMNVFLCPWYLGKYLQIIR